MKSLILSALAFAQTQFRPNPYTTYDPHYQLCDDINTPVSTIIGTSSNTIPLQLTTYAQGRNYQVSGSIVISSGCKFDVLDFYYVGGNESFWYGSYQENDANQGMTLSSVPVNQTRTQMNATYQFITTTGQEANYGGFNQFRLYTKDNVPVYVAFANIPLTFTKSRAPAFSSVIDPSTGQKPNSALKSIIAPLLLAFLVFYRFA